MRNIVIVCGVLLALSMIAQVSSANQVDEDIEVVDRYTEYYKEGITVLRDTKRNNICYVLRMGGGIGGISCLSEEKENKDHD